MSRQKYTLIEQLDPKDVTDISEGHKTTLLNSGLLPYRTSHGRIVWANEATRIYKISSRKPRSIFATFRKTQIHQPNRVKRGEKRNILRQIIHDFLPFILIVLLVAALLIGVLKYNFLIG